MQLKGDNKMGKNKLRKIIVVAMLIIMYVAADILMDIKLFPMLTESLKMHHKEIVARYMLFFCLIPVWIIGCLYFEKRKTKLATIATIISGSALISTVIYAFTSLPLVWMASTFTSSTSIFLFLHDYGLLVFFVVIIPILGYRYFKKRKEE
jgi:uncharacterized membrane protein (DUF373 family)